MQDPTNNHTPLRAGLRLRASTKVRIGLALVVTLIMVALGGPGYLWPGEGAKTLLTDGVGARPGVSQASMSGGAAGNSSSTTKHASGQIADPASRPTGPGSQTGGRQSTTRIAGEVPQVSPTPLTTQEQQTIDLINQRRVAMGLGAFQVDWSLVSAARRHSNDIGPHGLCQHDGTDGSSPWDRIAQAGYTGFGNGEVVGCGYDTPLSVVGAWWNSPGHYAILTNADADDIGCGWWLNGQGYGWQTCDTGISNRPRATATPVPTALSRTPSATNTRTPSPTYTRTRTPLGTATPTPILVGHVTWQGRPPQPNTLQQLPVTLTLKLNSTEVNYVAQNSDASGFFTVSVAGLVSGNYTWRVKGPQFLANSGNVTLGVSRVTNVEMGVERTGDADNDNLVGIVDVNILKVTIGKRVGDPGYDSRADFNGDNVVMATDFNLLRPNVGLSGAPPVRPDNP